LDKDVAKRMHFFGKYMTYGDILRDIDERYKSVNRTIFYFCHYFLLVLLFDLNHCHLVIFSSAYSLAHECG